MKATNTSLPGLLLIEPLIFSDDRGFFFENWNRAKYRDIGLPDEFSQDNISFSKQGVLRGLHFQCPSPQGKLVSVLEGEIFDVALDIRKGSPSFGKWLGFNLSSINHHQLWIPAGFAHGFCVLSTQALVSYKSSDYYSPKNESTIIWNDPSIKINWPVSNPIISDKDSRGIPLAQFSESKLPRF